MAAPFKNNLKKMLKHTTVQFSPNCTFPRILEQCPGPIEQQHSTRSSSKHKASNQAAAACLHSSHQDFDCYDSFSAIQASHKNLPGVVDLGDRVN